MIIFDLACTHEHLFEGWFASGEDFARQQDAGLVRCPVCDDATIVRRPSARVSFSKGAPPAPVATQAPAPSSAPTEAAAHLPPEVLVALREIVRNTENVGRRFPEEARKIHYEEIPARPIRGQASPEEAKALSDEGIEFAPLPDYLTAESH